MMSRSLLLGSVTILGVAAVVVTFLRGMTRLTVVIVNEEPFDVIDDVDENEDELHDDDHINLSHGYVPAV